MITLIFVLCYLSMTSGIFVVGNMVSVADPTFEMQLSSDFFLILAVVGLCLSLAADMVVDLLWGDV